MSDSLFFAIGSVLAILGTIGLIAGASAITCYGFEKGTGIETRWRMGCYANVGGAWVPKEYAFGKAHEIRVREKK